ncbi:MAG: hypothetical protein H6684_15130 [Deltaproteobacteria bacterium]|nr:hypothetical protein [Deltaproteobacteria bacterium]MCB9490065.1 hypothetical protein [Deltaproteobacteria bacterium]
MSSGVSPPITREVETISQAVNYPFNIHGKTPDGKVYTGTGTILLTGDRHMRRASYTITMNTITYRGTALLRGALDDNSIVMILDYHDRPSYKGMAVALHEQDPKSGKFIGRVLFQGSTKVCEEIITLNEPKKN